MSINLSWYDVTQLDFKQDINKTGAIDQSGTWEPLAALYQAFRAGIAQNRFKQYGNSQSLSINKRVKKWGVFEITYTPVKYEASPAPAWDWWNIINYAFWGGATGAPVLRPGSMFIGAKLNRATPEYWTFSDAKIEEIAIRGNMVTDVMSVTLRGVARHVRLDTNNYVQGTATRRVDPAKVSIVPATDALIRINNIDETANIQEWTLTLRRAYGLRGRADSLSGSASQIAVDGASYRELIPGIIEGRLDLTIDPVGTVSTQLNNYLSDLALNTCEIRLPNEINGKNIQFTASKIEEADQEHREQEAPSDISLAIEAQTLNVATL